MRRLLALAAILVSVCLLLAGPVRADNGRLLIVGGGLSLDNEAVYRALIDHRLEDAPVIAIISAASGYPVDSAASFAGALMHHGVPPEQIAVVRLAIVDDPDTPDVDESAWASNAGDAEEIAKIEAAGAIWFTGGDQLRLNRALVGSGGVDSPMLSVIRARLRDGAIVGGTSAGAAAMSSPMIVRGQAFDALFGAIGDITAEGSEDLAMIRGLRLFSPFVIDQHFAERGRVGRLARAVMAQPGPARIGIGVDEDTALLVDLTANAAHVIGLGSVTILDGRAATARAGRVADLRLSRLHDGDSMNLIDLAVEPAPSRSAVDDRQAIFGGLWPSIESLRALETDRRSLNIAEFRPRNTARLVARIAEGKRIAQFVFLADRETRAWRGQSDIGWNGTLTGIRLSLESEDDPAD